MAKIVKRHDQDGFAMPRINPVSQTYLEAQVQLILADSGWPQLEGVSRMCKGSP